MAHVCYTNIVNGVKAPPKTFCLAFERGRGNVDPDLPGQTPSILVAETNKSLTRYTHHRGTSELEVTSTTEEDGSPPRESDLKVTSNPATKKDVNTRAPILFLKRSIGRLSVNSWSWDPRNPCFFKEEPFSEKFEHPRRILTDLGSAT